MCNLVSDRLILIKLMKIWFSIWFEPWLVGQPGMILQVQANVECHSKLDPTKVSDDGVDEEGPHTQYSNHLPWALHASMENTET